MVKGEVYSNRTTAAQRTAIKNLSWALDKDDDPIIPWRKNKASELIQSLIYRASKTFNKSRTGYSVGSSSWYGGYDEDADMMWWGCQDFGYK